MSSVRHTSTLCSLVVLSTIAQSCAKGVPEQEGVLLTVESPGDAGPQRSGEPGSSTPESGSGGTTSTASGQGGGGASGSNNPASGGTTANAGAATTTACEPADCDDGDPCTEDVCNAGECSHPDNGDCLCSTDLDCGDGNPCTDETCNQGQCEYSNNTAVCASDDNVCTDDICADGECSHTDNGTCECQMDADCDDNDPCNGEETCSDTFECEGGTTLDCDDGEECTIDTCEAGTGCTYTNSTAACTDDADTCTNDVCNGGTCQHPDNGSCSGSPFTVNSFNSASDWGSSQTTPDGRTCSATGFAGTNLEAEERLWVAALNPSTLQMSLDSLTGLTTLVLEMNSRDESTTAQIDVGLFDGTWHEVSLASYGTLEVSDAPPYSYGSISIPLADFGAAPGSTTEMRLSFTPSGGERQWRIDNIRVE